MDSLTKEEKIKIINEQIDCINTNILWLNTNIGVLEEIPSPGKMTMEEQLASFIQKKAMLEQLIDQLQ